jgi:hypothetical protein
MRTTRRWWVLPLFSVAIGCAILAAQWIGGNLRGGLWSLLAMCGFAALLAVGGRSDTIRGIRGDGRDERFRVIDVTATAIAGTAVILTLIAVWLVELARGHDGSPYGELMAVGGLSYIAAVAFLRWRG